MGAFIRWIMQRAPKSDPRRRLIYAVFVMVAGIALFSLPFLAIDILLQPFPWVAVVINAILLKGSFSLRRLLEAGGQVEGALTQNNLPEARRLVSENLVSRDTHALDARHVASATVESLSENLNDSFIAPLLAFALGGVPLAWAYRFVNTTDALTALPGAPYESLRQVAARLDDILNWIPARLTGILLVVTAPLVGGDIRHAWNVMQTQHNQSASLNAGVPMSAAAGALGITLEKIDAYRLEGGDRLPIEGTITRAQRLIRFAALAGVTLIGILCLR